MEIERPWLLIKSMNCMYAFTLSKEKNTNFTL